MKHLKIENFGPLKLADVEIGRFNLIIGFQSSGKSCILKTACFCSWVEKRIMLSQSANDFSKGYSFKKQIEKYYKFDGFFKPNTKIEYESDYMKFSFDNAKPKFSFEWKENKQNYKRKKISYIPAERNIVAAFPNWRTQAFADDNVLDFMNDWYNARKFVKEVPDILNLDLTYTYKEYSDIDSLKLKDGQELTLANSSSGIQSLIPMYVYIYFLSKGIYKQELETDQQTYEAREKSKNLLYLLYNSLGNQHYTDNPVKITKQNIDFYFSDKAQADIFEEQVNKLTRTSGCEIFLEEPENNLFPPTQCQLIDKFVEMTEDEEHDNSFFIATHSPYVLNHLLEQKIEGFRFFFTHQTTDGSIVKQATEDEIQEIRINGVDMFFNFEAFI
ncbi:MAG: ATP-binding protein [Bacteroidales bacterium]|nr:ATP-binding protein [Bacteroidales bacterium]